MDPQQNLNDIVDQSCDQIRFIIDGLQPPYNEYNVVRDMINVLFTQLRNSGYSLQLNDYVDALSQNYTKKYVDTAHQTVESFSAASQKIESITKSHSIEIEKMIDEPRQIDVGSFKSRFIDFQNELFKELDTANVTIAKLEDEIQNLQRQSNIDPLTKLYNRKSLKNDIEQIIKHGEQKNLEVGILMVDADNFKAVNDSYGHIAGDKILIFLSKLFLSCIREHDKVYRYGGEEFVIILNRVRIKQAKEVGERILKTIRNNKLIFKDQIIRVTLSIGLTMHQKNDTLEAMLERSDAALYEAKREGKDRMIIH